MPERSKIHVPDWIRTLAPYPPGKPIEEVEREYGIPDSIKLASNENPLGPSPKALEAIAAAVDRLHRYPEGNCYYLRQALAARLDVPPGALLFGNGSNEIIELIVRTFLQAGEDAVMSDQAFVVYSLIVQAAGGRRRSVPLRSFTHDVGGIAAAITPQTRVVFLANPNNPTGTIFFKCDWELFLSLVPRDVVVVMDEAYAEYVEDDDYPDSLAAVREGRNIVVLRTFSKIYGLAGLRIGYGVAPPALVDLVDRVRQPFNVNSLAQAGALAALGDHAHVERSRACNREGMKHLRRACDRLGLEVVPSWANFLLVRVGDGAGVYQKLLERGVIVRPMAVYGFPEHVRVTIGTAPENERFVAALTEVLNG
jgi:histidinol-phosphate aminotransferase